MRVALVVMPLASAERPSLAAGLLKACLEERGIPCDVKHPNVLLAKLLGASTYRYLASEAPTAALAGEWAFSRVLFPAEATPWERYEHEVLERPVWGMARERRAHVKALSDAAPDLIALALESGDWSRYDVVGFTSTFEQTVPSLCLARAIKRRHPGVRIAVGGANFEADMGRPYLRRFPFLDYVCTGEGDVAFPALCEALRDGRDEVPPGFLYRRGGEVLESPRSGAFTSLDLLPVPDYTDFFRVHGATWNGNGGGPRPIVPLEASRGCWWGQKAHCTFCGLNGEAMAFRRKSASRVMREVETLTARHRPGLLQFADNILGMDAFDDLLPALAARPGGPPIFFEIKSNLRRGQVAALARAGVASVQAGIESFSDRSLAGMRKGVTGAQNVAVLRWAKESGVRAMWNLIYGFPHEEEADYDGNAALMRMLAHLDPPDACAPIRLDRFSPNFTRPDAHGFLDVRPVPAYGHIFPFPEDDLRELATYFDFRHARSPEVSRLARPIDLAGREWRERAAQGSSGTLAVRVVEGGPAHLEDTRFTRPAPASRRLPEAEVTALLLADAPTSRERILAAGGSPDALDRLLADEVVARVGNLLVTLALLPQGLSGAGLSRAR